MTSRRRYNRKDGNVYSRLTTNNLTNSQSIVHKPCLLLLDTKRLSFGLHYYVTLLQHVSAQVQTATIGEIYSTSYGANCIKPLLWLNFWRDNVFLRGVHLGLDYCAPWHAQAFLPDRYQWCHSWRRTVTIATMLLLCCLHLRRVKRNKGNIYSLEGSLRYKYKLHIAIVKINIE